MNIVLARGQESASRRNQQLFVSGSALRQERRDKETRNIEEQTSTAPLLLAAGVLRVRGTKQTSIGATSEILRGTEDL